MQLGDIRYCCCFSSYLHILSVAVSVRRGRDIYKCKLPGQFLAALLRDILELCAQKNFEPCVSNFETRVDTILLSAGLARAAINMDSSPSPPSTTLTATTRTTDTSTNLTPTSTLTLSKTTTASHTSTTSSLVGSGIATPVPTQPGIASDCDSFYLVKSRDRCATIIMSIGITMSQFAAWDAGVGGENCTTM